MLRLIDRYIFVELFFPFGLTLSALMLILLTEQMLRLADLFINKGVSFLTLGKIFLYLLPTFLVIAIPIAVLISTIIVFARMTADSEITGFKAGGVSLARLAMPVHGFTLLAFILTFVLSVWAQPWVNRSLKTAAVDLMKQELSIGLEAGTFSEAFGDMVIYVDQMPRARQLNGILIYDSRNKTRPVLTLAREGTVLSDPDSDIVGFRLINGSQYRMNTETDRYHWITFGKYEFKLNLAGLLTQEAEADRQQIEIQELQHRLSLSQTLSPKELNILVEYYKTYAFPFSCLVFGILGIPLGLAIKRGGRLGGFAAGMALALLYYLLMIISNFLVSSYALSPLIAAWLPNGMMLIAAVWVWAGSGEGRLRRT